MFEMNKDLFREVEKCMRGCMNENVHDALHAYRVLNYALLIVDSESDLNADMDVLIISALLHDICRDDERRNQNVCHAEAGANRAYGFLVSIGYDGTKAQHVSSCIRTHRFSVANRMESVEAQILYDADKLDLTGAVGTARTIFFAEQYGEPLYLLGKDGLPTEGVPTENASLVREYNRKLRFLHSKFHTATAKEIAREHQKTMDSYFGNLMIEVNENHKRGNAVLQKHLAG